MQQFQHSRTWGKAGEGEELRAARARRFSASAKHWGHPELLEQHIPNHPQLKSVLSVLR